MLGGLNRKPFYEASFNNLYSTYKKRAVKHGRVFSLDKTLFRFLTSSKCYYCGGAPSTVEQKRNFNGQYVYNGIDRLDSNFGYTPENSVPCCAVCNRAKMDMPVELFWEWIGRVRRPVGDARVTKIVDKFGNNVSLESAVERGWIEYDHASIADTNASERHFQNIFTDQGRQLMAYAFGFRPPVENYVCRRFGVGTGLSTPKVTDVVLQAPIVLASGQTTGLIDSVDFLTAFVVRVAFTLGISDANGYAISEMGLFSGNNTLIARKVRSTVINKNSEFAPTITWRIRF